MENKIIETDWLKIIGEQSDRHTDFFEVIFTDEIKENLYQQCLTMVGKRNVYFIPSNNDWNEFKRHNLGNSIIGSLKEVKKNVYGYISPINDVFVKLNIDAEFPFIISNLNAYCLHVGLDYTKTKFKPCDAFTSRTFTIESCEIKGFYFKELVNFNKIPHNNQLFSYYCLRGLGMYIYLPGRAYY